MDCIHNWFFKKGSREYILLSYSRFLPKLTQSRLHLVICEFVTLGIANFANTKSMGKECALLTKNAMYRDQIWMMLFLCNANQI